MQRNCPNKRFMGIIIPFSILLFNADLSAQINVVYTPSGNMVELADNSEQMIDNDEKTALRNYYAAIYPKLLF